MAEIDLSQVSPEMQAAIAQAVAKAVQEATNPQPVELSPAEKLAAAHKGIASAFRQERTSPAHNDHVLGAFETYLDELHDQVQRVLYPVAASSDATAVEPTAAHAGE